MPGCVEAWFGGAFATLHPLLQALHRAGGALVGTVELRFGRGLAGVIGRALARRRGVCAFDTTHRLRVSIRSDVRALHWTRCFDDGADVESVFVPVGRYPTGHWLESAGGWELRLGVSIVNGGWHWQHQRMQWRGLPLPALLSPRTVAYKEVRDGAYHFHVDVSLPLLGTFFSYGGNLQHCRADLPTQG